MIDLNGKKVLVTGASGGIGKAIAMELSSSGADLCLTGRNKSELENLQKIIGGNCQIIISDLSYSEGISNLADQAQDIMGQIDILVNNAAIFSSIQQKPFEQLSTQEWRSLVDVNVIGQFLSCKAVLPAFKTQGAGRIINISSGVAFKGNPHMLHYVASKGAIVSMTRALATELGEHNILVNSVAPGFTLSEGVMKNAELAKRSSQFSIRGRALARDMHPNDLVGAVAFFAGPGSAFITGQTLVVDGGAYYH